MHHSFTGIYSADLFKTHTHTHTHRPEEELHSAISAPDASFSLFCQRVFKKSRFQVAAAQDWPSVCPSAVVKHLFFSSQSFQFQNHHQSHGWNTLCAPPRSNAISDNPAVIEYPSGAEKGEVNNFPG